jgi:hypothetical protein
MVDDEACAARDRHCERPLEIKMFVYRLPRLKNVADRLKRRRPPPQRLQQATDRSSRRISQISMCLLPSNVTPLREFLRVSLTRPALANQYRHHRAFHVSGTATRRHAARGRGAVHPAEANQLRRLRFKSCVKTTYDCASTCCRCRIQQR